MPSVDTSRLPEKRNEKVLVGWRRLLPVYLYKHARGWRLRIFPLQFFAWSFLLSSGTYLAGGTALYLNDRIRTGLQEISWFDRIYPPNWPAYREARGQAYIAKAQSSLQSGNFAAAFHELRSGLARAPSDRDGRLLLADMLTAADRPDLAIETLSQGFAYHFSDFEYVSRTIRQLSHQREDWQIVKSTKELLDLHPDLPAPITRLLAISQANALYHRGHFDQAEEVLQTYELSPTADGRLLTAKIEWDRGFPDLAMAIINQLNRDFPTDLTVYRTQVKWLIELGEEDKARRLSLTRSLQNPNQAQPRIDLLYAFDKIGDETALNREVASFFSDFATQDAAILQIGDFAANTGRPALARRVKRHAEAVDLDLIGPSLMEVEALIVAGEFQSAIETARAMLESNPAWEDQMAPVFNGLQAIAYFALGDREEASLFLNSYLGLERVRAENLVAVASRLHEIGAQAEARRVLTQAVTADPLNQAALARLIELDLKNPDAPELPGHVARLLTMRRASPTLLREAYDVLGQDRYLFATNRNLIMNRLLESLQGKTTFPETSGI